MKSFLKFVLVVAIIALICLLCYAGKTYTEDPNTKLGKNSNTVTTSNNAVSSSKVSGSQVTEQKPNNVKTNATNEVQKPEEKTEGKEVNSLSNEDKAIDLAKKEFGITDGVYFRIEQVESDGVYIVSARDAETTKNLAWYTVDVNAGTVK